MTTRKSATKDLAVHFSSASDEWPTPQFLFDALNAEFKFTLDPSATPENAKCETYFTKLEDGLKQSWEGHRTFVNPPYGKAIRHFVAKAHETGRRGYLVVCLLPARTDTAWWHDHVMRSAEIRFLRGRLTFGGAVHPAPFPSVIVVFRPWVPWLGSRGVRPLDGFASRCCSRSKPLEDDWHTKPGPGSGRQAESVVWTLPRWANGVLESGHKGQAPFNKLPTGSETPPLVTC